MREEDIEKEAKVLGDLVYDSNVLDSLIDEANEILTKYNLRIDKMDCVRFTDKVSNIKKIKRCNK